MLELDRLTLRIGSQLLAEDLSLQLQPGQVHVVIGPNGTGKTSLLRALFGDLALQAGQIRLDGRGLSEQRLPQWRRQFGYMPQDTRMDLDLSVLEVVLLGKLERLGMRVDDATLLEALEALRSVGLVELADREIHTLSGGQRQMALFAQVLLRSPRIMMLDEPVSALDLQHQIRLMDHLHRKTREHGWITLVVLHDLNLAAQYADRLIVLGGGRLQAFGPPTHVLSAGLIERLYHVPVDVTTDRFGHPHVRALRYLECAEASAQQD